MQQKATHTGHTNHTGHQEVLVNNVLHAIKKRFVDHDLDDDFQAGGLIITNTPMPFGSKGVPEMA